MPETPKITAHQVNDCNRGLTIDVMDAPGPGGANCDYRVSGMVDGTTTRLRFHSGDVKGGPRGLTNEAMLAVLIHRVEGFQSGPFACEDNAAALHNLRSAMAVMNKRTAARAERGVEGTQKP